MLAVALAPTASVESGVGAGVGAAVTGWWAKVMVAQQGWYTRFLWLLLVVVTVLFVAPLSRAEPAVQPLTIAISPDSAPYHFVDERGQPAGVLVDVWRAWSQVMHQPVQFVAMPWAETLQAVVDGRADIHIGMSYNEQRGQQFDFGNALQMVESNLYVHRSLAPVHRLVDLLPYRIGVISGSQHQVQLPALEPRLSLALYPTRIALYEAALAGEIQVMAGLERFSDSYPQREPLEVLFPYSERLTYGRTALQPAVAKGRGDLVNLINDGMGRLPATVFAEARSRWLGTATPAQALRIGAFADFHPYSSVDELGQPRGLLIDLWQELGKRSGYPVEFVVVPPELMLARLAQGELESIVGMPASDKVAAETEAAVSMFAARAQFFVRVGGKINTPADLDQAITVGTLVTEAYLPQLRDQFPLAQIHTVSTPAQLVEGLLAGRFDAVITESAMTRVLLQQNGASAAIVALDNPTFSSDIQAVVAPGNTTLARRLAEGFGHIPPATLAELETRWLQDPRDRYFDNMPLQMNLSPDELLWLTQNPRLRVGVLRELPPLIGLAEGKPDGVWARLGQWLEQQLKIAIDWVPFDHPQLLADALRRGQLDLAFQLQDRNSDASGAFTVPFWQLSRTLVSKGEGASSWRQLEGQAIAIRLGDPLQTWLPMAHPAVEVRLFASSHSAVLAVAAGDVAGYIDIQPVVDAALADGGQDLQQVNLVGLPDMVAVIGVAAEQPVLNGIINKQLRALGGQERRQILGDAVVVLAEEGHDPHHWQFGLIGAATAGLLVSLWLWQRERHWRQRLQREAVQLIHQDPATGALNRRGMELHLGQSMAIHARSGQLLALMMVEVRSLPSYSGIANETLTENAMLILTQRFQQMMRRADGVARIASRRFALVACNLSHRQQALDLARKLSGRARQPMVIAGHSIQVEVLVGVALFPLDATHSEPMLLAAEARLDDARRGLADDGIMVSPVEVTSTPV